MTRRLKVFRGHFGFYDTVVAAPSRKEALKAWGLHANAFAQGDAATTKDEEAVKAALARPGAVLRRPFGTDAPFRVDPEPVPMLKGHRSKGHKRPSKSAHAERSQTRLRAVRRELEEAKKAKAAALRELDRRQRELQHERRKIESAAQSTIAKVKKRLR